MSLKKIKSLLNKNDFDFYYLECVDSTMSEIKKYNFKKNICLMANQQTKGFGRRGTTWESPKGNIYISILFKSIVDIQNHFINNAFTTNIICNVLEKVCNVKTEIKWPNDILINDKKISGIITEIYNNNNVNFINTGFGINVMTSPNLDNYLTTNINAYQKEINNFSFAFELMEEYFKNFHILISHSESILEMYKSRLKYLGSQIKLKINDNLFKEGILFDLNNDGSIILKSESTSETIYNARIIK
ncbi:MAG: biotin--[acetyl-CoA-carboxylase] ligase [Pelagibacteraceae bacterium TMED237]|nr:MAG: biotin--[acetyl-CoA-carboxylase] ligase [Pelagibacteraceae bacterium TMED237]|tara:strand:+ start:860 stop:1597 length:738 start_codon:yes stop_codon:yes gene_type:complete